MLCEMALTEPPPRAVVFAGATVFAAAKLLKWWAIATLGPAWTFRVLVVPNVPPVVRGPYRFIRHPNYVGVAGELAGAALLTGARAIGPIAWVVFAALLARRIGVENQALRWASKDTQERLSSGI
jgi:methyltransferase